MTLFVKALDANVLKLVQLKSQLLRISFSDGVARPGRRRAAVDCFLIFAALRVVVDRADLEGAPSTAVGAGHGCGACEAQLVVLLDQCCVTQ